MKLFRDEAGQTMVFTALLMCCLLGFMALALDVGVLFRAQRRLQVAADAGAAAAGLAAEYNMSVTGCTGTPAGTASASVKCAVAKAALGNGITDATQITVNNPATTGYHTGAEYYEVLVQQPNPTLFMKVFSQFKMSGAGGNFGNVMVGARAVSGIVPGQACVYALDKTARDAFDVQGAAIVNVPNCSIQINSSASDALCTTGGKATINAIYIGIVGAQDKGGKCNGTQANATTGVGQVGDPLAGLTMPTCNAGNTISNGNNSKIVMVGGAAKLETSAGTNPIALTPVTQTSGSTTASVICFSDSNVTVAGGVTLGTSETATDSSGNSITVGGNEVFVFNNGVTIGGTVQVWGTIDDAGGSFTEGNSALSIGAPSNSSYTYNGIALMVPPANTVNNSCGSSYNSFKGDPAPGGCLQIQFGSGSGNLDGMIYAPDVSIYMQDNGGGNVVTAIIADEIYDKSSNLEITNNYNLIHPTSPLNHVTIVE